MPPRPRHGGYLPGICVALLTLDAQGGKNRRRGTKENDDQRRELTFKEDGQEYAQVIKMLGNGRLEALCFDGSKRLANVRRLLPRAVPLPPPPPLLPPSPFTLHPFLTIFPFFSLFPGRGVGSLRANASPLSPHMR